MKYKKHINLTMLIAITLAIAVVLAACGYESSSQNNNDTLNNDTGGYYTDNVQDNRSNDADEPTDEPTPSEPAPYEPTPSTPSVELDIPDYITIRGRQFSTELTELNLMRWDLNDYDIEPLRYMINLTSLDLNHNPISDLSPLAGLTNLRSLKLLDNTSTDLTPLAGLANLTTLELSLRHFHDTDLTPLAGLTSLTSFRLSLGGNQVNDISRLAGLTHLTRLDLWHNQISDLTPLANLTNLRDLDLSFNPVDDITPLVGLTNLNTLFMHNSPGIDLSLLYNIPPRVLPPVVPNAPANPHPFADALASFFVNLTTAAEWFMPYNSYHAVLVDVDGQGTPGVVASRWAFDCDRHNPLTSWDSISIHPSFAQRLFFIYDNQLHEVDGRQWGVTPSGRLVALSFTGASDILMTEYILLNVDDGRLVGVKSISITEQTWGDNYYSVNYHIDEFFTSDFEQRQSLTRAELDEMMDMYSLHGTSIHIWELPDDTYEILGMIAE